MSRLFKAGERVAIYDAVRGTGKVTQDQLGPSAGVWVQCDHRMLAEDKSLAKFVSPKQLRRLVNPTRIYREALEEIAQMAKGMNPYVIDYERCFLNARYTANKAISRFKQIEKQGTEKGGA